MMKKDMLFLFLFCFFTSVKLDNLDKELVLSLNQSKEKILEDVLVENGAADINNITVTISTPTTSEKLGR